MKYGRIVCDEARCRLLIMIMTNKYVLIISWMYLNSDCRISKPISKYDCEWDKQILTVGESDHLDHHSDACD